MRKIVFVICLCVLFLIFLGLNLGEPRISAQPEPELWGVYYNSQTDTFLVLFDPAVSGNQCLRMRGKEIEVGCYIGYGYWSDSVILKFGDYDICKFEALADCLIFDIQDHQLLFAKEKMTIREFLKDKI